MADPLELLNDQQRSTKLLHRKPDNYLDLKYVFRDVYSREEGTWGHSKNLQYHRSIEYPW